MSDKQPPPFELTDDEMVEIIGRIEAIMKEYTNDFATCVSTLISLTASLCETQLVETNRWKPESVIAMRDFFVVNILRSHDTRLRAEGGDPNVVTAGDVVSVDALKRSGLMQ